MKYRVPDNADLLKQVPSDLSLESCGRDDFVIRHVRTGMGCLNAFAIVCLAGWMVGCVSLLRDYFRGGQMEDGGPIPIWFVLLFWGLEIAVAVLLLNVIFRKKTFPVKKGKLIIETDLLWFKWHKIILKGSIRKLVQVKDGGEDDDRFPSWGLRIEGEN